MDAADYDKRCGFVLFLFRGQREKSARWRLNRSGRRRRRCPTTFFSRSDPLLPERVTFRIPLSLSLSPKQTSTNKTKKKKKKKNRTALHIAAAEGNIAAIQIILEEGGANCSPLDRWSATPLLEAVKAKRGVAVDALLARGAASSGGLGIDENTVSGLLCSAAESKDMELIGMYIKAAGTAKVLDSADYDKRTALHLASAEGNSEIVEALLRAGASPLIKDRWGATPLDEAKREGRSGTVKVLEAVLK